MHARLALEVARCGPAVDERAGARVDARRVGFAARAGAEGRLGREGRRGREGRDGRDRGVLGRDVRRREEKRHFRRVLVARREDLKVVVCVAGSSRSCRTREREEGGELTVVEGVPDVAPEVLAVDVVAVAGDGEFASCACLDRVDCVACCVTREVSEGEGRQGGAGR